MHPVVRKSELGLRNAAKLLLSSDFCSPDSQEENATLKSVAIFSTICLADRPTERVVVITKNSPSSFFLSLSVRHTHTQKLKYAYRIHRKKTANALSLTQEAG